MSEALDNLNTEVQELIEAVSAERTVIQAATIAITGLTDQQAALIEQLEAALEGGDIEAVQAAADAISEQNNIIIEQTAALAAAIPENTVQASRK